MCTVTHSIEDFVLGCVLRCVLLPCLLPTVMSLILDKLCAQKEKVNKEKGSPTCSTMG